MAIQPYKGATTSTFYVEEVVAGVTPANPVWKPLRSTGGFPALTRDALISNELDGSREVTSIRTGNKQVAGEFAVELSQSSQDEFLAGAFTSTWEVGATVTGLSITVNPAAKTFTRAAGDFTDDVAVGDLIQFPSLTNGNAKPFIVTAVTPLVVTGAGIQHTLTSVSGAATSLTTSAKLRTGDLCKSYTIATFFKGKCGTADSMIFTRGVEITGFTIEQAVNAFVTGTFPVLGLSQEIITPAGFPTGSTFSTFTAEPFSSVDVSAFEGSALLKLIDTFSITNENGTSAQFELGNSEVAFIERGRATNTFSLAGKMYDTAMLSKFLNETKTEITSMLSGASGVMTFTLRNADFTAVTPEIGGAESVTISIEGQATGKTGNSSVLIQRIVYP